MFKHQIFVGNFSWKNMGLMGGLTWTPSAKRYSFFPPQDLRACCQPDKRQRELLNNSSNEQGSKKYMEGNDSPGKKCLPGRLGVSFIAK